ncbi:MAG: diacylglycerol/lipid kinase family protein [Gemmatimonadaceae bacterium]
MTDGARIPAFVNPRAGSAAAARAAIEADPRFDLRVVEPAVLADAVRAAVAAGARRVLVCGGDGTVATAAAVVAGSDVELAVLPGGTLNHFARHLSIPTDPVAALAVAVDGVACSVDAGRVNGRLFINTSSVGVYVAFVRLRERWKPRLGYWLASLVAAVRLFVVLPRQSVVVEVDGDERHYRTPLLFVGVGERELSEASLRQFDPEGRRGLHVVVVHGWRKASIVIRGAAAARRGPRAIDRLSDVDSIVVDACRVTLRHRLARLALDGELATLESPLEYRAVRGALRVMVGR